MRDYFYLTLYYTLRFFFKYFPKCVKIVFLKIATLGFYIFDRKHTKIMRKNISFCFTSLSNDEINALIKKTYFNFGLFLSEFVCNQNANKEQILSQISFENEEILKQALENDRPIIVQTAHFGNWELFSLAMAAKFGAVSIIGRKLDSAKMNEILSANRTRFDIELIEKSGAAKGIINALKARRLLGVLVDQSVSGSEGVECEFFGRRIMHTHALSVFASKLGALIIPAFIERSSKDESKFNIVFYPAIDIKELESKHGKEEALKIATQAQSTATQLQIQRKSDEYFWMHKKFKYFYKELYA